jgi:hypothetical protein
MGSPNTEVVQDTDHVIHETYRKGTRNLRKHTLASKVVNPFTHALSRLLLQGDEKTLTSREYPRI